MKRVLTLAMFFLASLSPGSGAEDWGPAQFLIGQWTGDGAGQPGQGTGSFSFAPDLQGKVLVRRSFAAYPAANGKPASRHDDLMIVYRDETSRQLRAMYFDSEEHVIPYSVQPADGGGVVFVTEGAPNTMRYRLTYSSTGAGRLKLKFEIAPPGKDFATYLEGAAHRDRGAKQP
jgi:hypothetical protein